MRPDAPRPEVVGPDDGPEAPFPLRMGGTVVSGFGRGSKELGIPTANIPVDSAPWIEKAESGVYFGWASLQLPEGHPSLKDSSSTPSGPSTTFTESSSLTQPVSHVKFPQTALDQRWRLYPMVMSIGYNPFYKNTVRSAEVHVMHRFEKDFYGSEMRLKLLGYIRPEYDYVDVEALVGDIKTDIEVTGRSLGRKAWGEEARDPWLAVCESDDVEKSAEGEEAKSA